MKKITLLLTLLLCVAGTAWAQGPVSPGAGQVLTAEALQALESETYVAIKSVETDSYGSKWYAGTSGNGLTNYYAVNTMFIWEPGAEAGSGYLKKAYPTAAEGAGYIQTTGFANFGAKSSAQVFYPIKPTSNWSGGDQIPDGYNADNLVRLLAGDNASATTWVSFNGLDYSGTNKTGVWTAMEIRRATPCTNTPVTNLANLSNNKAYTLVNVRTSFMMNADNTSISTRKDQSNAAYDAANTKQQFAVLTNNVGTRFLYSISARKFISNDGSVSGSPTEVTLLNGNRLGSTFFLKFDNSHHVNTSNAGNLVIDGWSYADDGNSNVIYEVADVAIAEADLAKIQAHTVTANFYITADGEQKLYKSATFHVLVNSTLTQADLAACIADAPYVSIVSWDKTDAVTADCEVSVSCNENLPFTKSESVENATWYLIDMHSNDNGAGDILNGSKNYLWTATTDAAAYTTAEVTLPKYDTKQSAAFGDNMLWCFVGNAADGFKIYNKAAGSEYALSKPTTGNSDVKLAAVADATPFRLYKSAQVNGGVCFKKEGDSHYINTQKPNGFTNKVLRSWNAVDGGSSCRFFAPDYYLLNYAADVPAGPAHSLGTAQYFNTEGKYDSFKTAVANANSNHHNLTYTTALATVLTEYAADKTTNSTTITNNGYYRLMNCAYGGYLTSGTYNNENVLWGGEIESTARSFAGTIVKVVENGDNYKLYVQGLEVGTVVKDTHVKLTAAGGTFRITNTNNKYVFADVTTPEPADPTYRCLHHASGNRIIGWVASDEASKWYVIPATELEVSLHTVDNKTYATTYLPFDATLPANVKAYIVTEAQNGLATMSEVTDIRANQGIVLVGQNGSATEATLTIGTATSDFNGNLLQGTNVPTTIQNADDYYILGFSENGNGVGFYHPNSTTLKANRAYLPKSNVATLNSSFSLDFENVSTGIEAAATNAEQGAACYDLSGRRVNRPAKGLYVKNGKKIIVK